MSVFLLSFPQLLFVLFAQACQTVIKIYMCILIFINVGPGKVFKMLNTPGAKLLLPPLLIHMCVPWLKPYPGSLLPSSPHPLELTLLFVLCHTHTHFFGSHFNQLQKLINFLATQQMRKRALQYLVVGICVCVCVILLWPLSNVQLQLQMANCHFICTNF